jgi:hypothetical protein
VNERENEGEGRGRKKENGIPVLHSQSKIEK